MIGKEDPVHVLKSIKDYYFQKLQLRQSLQREGEGKNAMLFDMHDGKMLYILTGHSLWNRKHFPFLLCTCARADGVKDTNHCCNIMSNDKNHRLQ